MFAHQDWLVYCGMIFNNAWEIWWDKIPLPICWNVTSWPRRSPVLPVLLQDLQSSRLSSHSWNMRSSGSRWHWIPHLLLAGLVAKTWIQVEVKLQEHRISAKQDKEIPCPQAITAIPPIPPSHGQVHHNNPSPVAGSPSPSLAVTVHSTCWGSLTWPDTLPLDASRAKPHGFDTNEDLWFHTKLNLGDDMLTNDEYMKHN